MTPKQFKSWRKRLGWTQVRAARELGIGLSTLKRLETGETPIRDVYQLACRELELQHGRQK